MPKGIPIFLFKNFGKYRKNVGINRFCMYVEGNEDDHSHQPYAEADKRVRSEAGQIQAVRGESRRIRPVGCQPCRIYRCGVVSRPRQDVQTRKGKHWNERQPNDTAHANDRDGNGLRDREHAGRPGTGPIRNGSRHDHHTARCRRSKPGRTHVQRLPDRHIHRSGPMSI